MTAIHTHVDLSPTTKKCNKPTKEIQPASHVPQPFAIHLHFFFILGNPFAMDKFCVIFLFNFFANYLPGPHHEAETGATIKSAHITCEVRPLGSVIATKLAVLPIVFDENQHLLINFKINSDQCIPFQALREIWRWCHRFYDAIVPV